MGIQTIYDILRHIVDHLADTDSGFTRLPEKPDMDASISDLGLDMVTLPEVLDELKRRLDGKEVGLPDLTPGDYNSLTLRHLLKALLGRMGAGVENPLVVYVDDEEENLFVLKRRLAKHLDIRTFSDPEEALVFIRSEPRVALVITDEVMPRLGGNALCSAVRKFKPYLKFILITGNPNNDQDLMYNSLKHNRFYEFLNKPLDFENKSEEYLSLIRGLIDGNR